MPIFHMELEENSKGCKLNSKKANNLPLADSIICDVHITEAYVLSLFLEWVVLFTLAIVALGMGFGFGTKKDKTYSEEIMKEKANSKFPCHWWHIFTYYFAC